MPIELGMEILADVLAQHDVSAEEFIPLSMEEMRWTRVLMTKWCEHTTIDARRVVEAEKRFFADLRLKTGEVVPITGQLDLLLTDPPHGLVIVDYKSGWARPKDPRNEAEAEREGGGLTELGWAQNLIYCFLLFENFPTIDYVIFREVHVMWGKERRAKTERWEMNERLRDLLVAKVTQLHLAVREGPESARWTPSAGVHCALCARPQACPIMDDEDIDVSTPRGRQLVAQEWIVAGAARSHRTKILHGLIDQHGPVEIPHVEGRKAVGWKYEENGRRMGIMDVGDVEESPYDEKLADAMRTTGALRE